MSDFNGYAFCELSEKDISWLNSKYNQVKKEKEILKENVDTYIIKYPKKFLWMNTLKTEIDIKKLHTFYQTTKEHYLKLSNLFQDSPNSYYVTEASNFKYLETMVQMANISPHVALDSTLCCYLSRWTPIRFVDKPQVL